MNLSNLRQFLHLAAGAAVLVALSGIFLFGEGALVAVGAISPI